MNTQTLISLLPEFDQAAVEVYAKYCQRLESEQKNGQPKNPWMKQRSEQHLADYFKAVTKDGLQFDGKHITLQSTGISYDYVAFRNKMLLAYPESLIDMGLVYKDDDFEFKKESGFVHYRHSINNPFGQNDQDIKGAYCVIKNKRGEFLTLLSRDDIDKHRKVAKTDYIWKSWFPEMCLKTVIKKACKNHFDDLFTNIETLDNENYDVEKPLGISVETKGDIEKLNTVPELNAYFKTNEGKNAGVMKDFIKALADRKEQIVKESVRRDEEAAA